MELRDMPNPSGADVEAYVNRQLAKMVGTGAASGNAFRASDYDIRCEKANSYPGPGWEYVGAVGVGIDVIIIWRMSRVKQTEMGLAPVMPVAITPARPHA